MFGAMLLGNERFSSAQICGALAAIPEWHVPEPQAMDVPRRRHRKRVLKESDDESSHSTCGRIEGPVRFFTETYRIARGGIAYFRQSTTIPLWQPRS